jgi:uncharacterized protein YbjT (DUF2867 family)
MNDLRTRIAVLAGATGLVGGCCLQALLHSPDYTRIIVLTRRPGFNFISAGRTYAQVERRLVDFDHLSAADLAAGGGAAQGPILAHDVFCALGTTIKKAGSQAAFRKVDFGYIVNLARAAAEAGAKRFMLVSSVGADPHSRNFYLRVKGETEQAVSALPFEAVHIFRPGLLLGHRSEKRAGERIAQGVMPKLNFVLAGGLRKYRAVPAETVANAMVRVAAGQSTGVQVYEYAQIIRFGENDSSLSWNQS